MKVVWRSNAQYVPSVPSYKVWHWHFLTVRWQVHTRTHGFTDLHTHAHTHMHPIAIPPQYAFSFCFSFVNRNAWWITQLLEPYLWPSMQCLRAGANGPTPDSPRPFTYLLVIVEVNPNQPRIRNSLNTPIHTRHCPTTVGQNIHLLWKQTDFDFTVRQSLVSDENSAC